jgi:hypothetical protein
MRSAIERRHLLAATLTTASLVVLAACGGSSEATGGDQVASLVTDEEATTEADEATADQQSVDQAALEFSQCLRDEGLDVADIGVDANGNIDLRSSLESVGPDTEGFREALNSCRDVLEGVGFGGRGGPGGLADNTDIADAMLEFSDCVRSEGFEDVPDLTFGGRGADAPPEGAPPAAGGGNREGGFGDRTARFAAQLELDPEDPEVLAAMDACMPIVDQAFTDAGVGQPPGS